MEAEAEKQAALHDMQRRSPAAAEASGSTLINLVIRDEDAGLGGRILLTFGKRNQTLTLPWTRLGSGTPVILSEEGAKALSRESAAIDFVRDAFGHLKAIAADKGGQALLKIANVLRDAGVVDTSDGDAFIAAAKTRQWDREKFVRTLA